jgi:hypothetical protein
MNLDLSVKGWEVHTGAINVSSLISKIERGVLI